MKPSERPSTLRPSIAVICTLAVIGLLGLVVAAGAIALLGRYDPERFPGGIDLVRGGMAWFFAWVILMFGVLAVDPVAAWIATRDRAALALGLRWIGLILACLAMLALFVWSPGPGRSSAPGWIAILLFVGVGIMLLGAARTFLSAIADAIRRRDRAVIALLLIYAALFAIGLVIRQL